MEKASLFYQGVTMEFLVLLSFVFVFVLCLGSVFGWISFVKLKDLASQVEKLKQELQLLRMSHLSLNRKTQSIQQQEPSSEDLTEPATDSPPIQSEEAIATEIEIEPEAEPESTIPEIKPVPSITSAYEATPESNEEDWQASSEDTFADDIFSKFKDNWMLWIGGLSVALAGVFLARYAIQHGVLGPIGRITAGIFSGLALHISAEYLRRKLANNHPSFAMLAAGGSITLFATLLAALHYYQMFSPMLVFIVLAIVAVATMWLSLIHGPILAAMGMIGAYVLPIMVSTGSGNVLAALAYSLIITGSILLLLQHVNRAWLWYGMLAGSLFWWLASLDSNNADLWRQWYLAILAYSVLTVITRDWLFARQLTFESGDKFYSIFSKKIPEEFRWIVPSLFLIVLAQQISILSESSYQLYSPAWIPMAIIVMLAARNNAYLSTHAWVMLLGSLGAILLHQVDEYSESIIVPIGTQFHAGLLENMTFITLIFAGMSFYNSKGGVIKTAWKAMTLITPILVMITIYLAAPSVMADNNWTYFGLVLGALYIFLAKTANTKGWDRDWEIWLYLSGHFAYSFAVTAFFENGTLTLALALQTITLAWIIKHYQMPQLGWLLKLVVTVVVLRLTANPWLLDYPSTVHWTAWTYGGSFIAATIAIYFLREFERLRRWAEGAAMHLLVLAIWVECRYYLYDGVVFESRYTFTEAALTTFIFGLLALVYYYRSSLGKHSQRLYRYYSYTLMFFALGNYAIILLQTMDNDTSIRNYIVSTPIWNIMILAYGFPIVLARLSMKYFEPRTKQFFEYFLALSAFVFINLEIRHLWQGNLDLSLPTSDGEFYTYSVFWLVASIAMVILGSFKLGRKYYKLGLSMLALVVVKVFVFDMSQLDGIYRILAFMGLGLSLLAMAYVHKKLVLILDQREQEQAG